MLQLVDARPGHCVLEVGTGSGYSTALLAHLVGSNGCVISLDLDPTMTERAQLRLSRDGRKNTRVLHADGQLGYASATPYDRLVAWASAANAVPSVWIEQVIPGGVLVAPLRREKPVVVRLKILSDGKVAEERVINVGFIPLTAEPYRPWESSEHGRPQAPWTPRANHFEDVSTSRDRRRDRR